MEVCTDYVKRLNMPKKLLIRCCNNYFEFTAQHDWDHEIVAAGFGCLAILGETVIYELDADDKVLTDEDVKNLGPLFLISTLMSTKGPS